MSGATEVTQLIHEQRESDSLDHAFSWVIRGDAKFQVLLNSFRIQSPH